MKASWILPALLAGLASPTVWSSPTTTLAALKSRAAGDLTPSTDLLVNFGSATAAASLRLNTLQAAVSLDHESVTAVHCVPTGTNITEIDVGFATPADAHTAATLWGPSTLLFLSKAIACDKTSVELYEVTADPTASIPSAAVTLPVRRIPQFLEYVNTWEILAGHVGPAPEPVLAPAVEARDALKRRPTRPPTRAVPVRAAARPTKPAPRLPSKAEARPTRAAAARHPAVTAPVRARLATPTAAARTPLRPAATRPGGIVASRTRPAAATARPTRVSPATRNPPGATRSTRAVAASTTRRATATRVPRTLASATRTFATRPTFASRTRLHSATPGATFSSPPFMPTSRSARFRPSTTFTPLTDAAAATSTGEEAGLQTSSAIISETPQPTNGPVVDPATGLPVDRAPIDPVTGLPVDPAATPVDPATGLPLDPAAAPVDPATGLPVDPAAAPVDPATGLPINPTGATPIDPATGLPINIAPTGTATTATPTDVPLCPYNPTSPTPSLTARGLFDCTPINTAYIDNLLADDNPLTFHTDAVFRASPEGQAQAAAFDAAARKTYNASLPLNINYDATTGRAGSVVPLYSVGPVTLDCENCWTRGSVNVSVAIRGAGFTVTELTARVEGGVEANVDVALTAAAAPPELGFKTDAVQIALFKLSAFGLDGVLTIGPQLRLSAQAGVAFAKSMTLTTGVALSIPHFSATLDLMGRTHTASGFTPLFTPHKPSIASAATTTITLSAAVQPELFIGVELFGGAVFSGGAGLAVRAETGITATVEAGKPTAPDMQLWAQGQLLAHYGVAVGKAVNIDHEVILKTTERQSLPLTGRAMNAALSNVLARPTQEAVALV
ncbi:hypothetical protein DFJ77DRAFT_525107 [Powellomyces hirtus]|nr:hypothetical protein DFJ77DRAFT_525107 [Powellomyces hirtus]